MAQTIETIDDFLRILRERPDIRDAVRREILSDELLALPNEVAITRDIIEGIDQRQCEHSNILEDHSRLLREHSEMLVRHSEMLMQHSEMLTNQTKATARLTEAVDAVIEKQAEHSRTLDRHTEILDGHTEAISGLAQKQEEHTEAISGLAQKQEEHTKAIEGLLGEMKALRTDIGGLKGLFAMMQVERRYAVIADEMGLEPVRLLTEVEMLRLSRSEMALREYGDRERESFRNCDLMIEADSPDEGECYIAVQVSYTVDHGDIKRALDHAEMMTRFTGKPAYAAVAGAGRSGVTERRMESGSIHWHRLPLRIFNPR